MRQVNGNTSAARARLLLYAIAFPGALALDFVTPLGVADWLIEVVLVWIASVWGATQEMIVVGALGSTAILVGLWSSPPLNVPFWMGGLNRAAGILVIGGIVDVTRRRRAAEEAKRQVIDEIQILETLVPICSACKAIRTPAGEWQKLETYLSSRSRMLLTHSLCPPCAAKYRHDLDAFSPEA
jgi:hypothetical protein